MTSKASFELNIMYVCMYVCILTPEEENTVTQYVLCKNRAYQGMNRKKLTNLIMDVLTIPDHANRKMKGGRKLVALTTNAKKALSKKR